MDSVNDILAVRTEGIRICRVNLFGLQKRIFCDIYKEYKIYNRLKDKSLFLKPDLRGEVYFVLLSFLLCIGFSSLTNDLISFSGEPLLAMQL